MALYPNAVFFIIFLSQKILPKLLHKGNYCQLSIVQGILDPLLLTFLKFSYCYRMEKFHVVTVKVPCCNMFFHPVTGDYFLWTSFILNYLYSFTIFVPENLTKIVMQEEGTSCWAIYNILLNIYFLYFLSLVIVTGWKCLVEQSW